MAMMHGSFARLLLALVAVSVAAGGCAAPEASRRAAWEQLLANREESAARRWFLEVLRANGVDEGFQEAMSRPPIGKRDWEVETLRTIPGSNGLVYVQLRPDPEYIPGAQAELEHWAGPERFWFFFDRSGQLLAWSNNLSGTWLVADVTGDGTKDLLVSTGPPKGLEGRQETLGRAYYTLFGTSAARPSRTPFGFSGQEGLTYTFTLIHLCDSSVPLVMTYEGKDPLEDDANEPAEWTYTVIRSFKGGEPKVILVARDHLELRTGPAGSVLLQAANVWPGDDRDCQVRYDVLKRRFSVEWLKEGEEGWNPVFFSTTVPR